MWVVLAAVCFLAIIPKDVSSKYGNLSESWDSSYDQDGIYTPDRNCSLECNGTVSETQPVCGSDRKIYYINECELCREKVTAAEWENCRGLHPLCPGRCLGIQDPVCGKDGKFYPNLCVMHSRNCGKLMGTQPLKYCLAGERAFRSYQLCPTTCLEIYKPVCGSNGVVYLNECYLRRHTCDQDVQVVGIAQCVLVRKCPQLCVALYDPVCGSDGKLYLNTCRMLKDNCGKRIKKMARIHCQATKKI